MKDFKLFSTVLFAQLGLILMMISCGANAEGKEDETKEATEEINEITLNYDDCLGDYVGLETDINKLFLKSIKAGPITVGQTSKTQMEELTGDPSGLARDFEGVSLTAIYTYENDILQSISIDCFYLCDGALDLLPVDQAAISHSINSNFGKEAAIDGGGNSDSENWVFNGMTIKKSNYEDGFGIYINSGI